MNKLAVVLSFIFLLTANQVQASSDTKTTLIPFFEKGVCYPSFPLNYFLNQKLSKDTYGLGVIPRSDFDCTRYGIINCQAIIHMDPHYSFKKSGRINVFFEYIKTVRMPLVNGFTSNVDILKQCTKRCTDAPNSNFCPDSKFK